MKVVRNNVCFVEVDDLLRYPIPDFIDIFTWLDYGKFASFVDKKEIKYFQERKDIVNYDEVANLTEKELDKKILKVYGTLSKKANEWLSKKEKIDKNIETYHMIKDATAIYECLTNYKMNRKTIDERIKELEINIGSNDKEIEIISTNKDKDVKQKTYQKQYVNRLIKTLEK